MRVALDFFLGVEFAWGHFGGGCGGGNASSELGEGCVFLGCGSAREGVEQAGAIGESVKGNVFCFIHAHTLIGTSPVLQIRLPWRAKWQIGRQVADIIPRYRDRAQIGRGTSPDVDFGRRFCEGFYLNDDSMWNRSVRYQICNWLPEFFCEALGTLISGAAVSWSDSTVMKQELPHSVLESTPRIYHDCTRSMGR